MTATENRAAAPLPFWTIGKDALCVRLGCTEEGLAALVEALGLLGDPRADTFTVSGTKGCVGCDANHLAATASAIAQVVTRAEGAATGSQHHHPTVGIRCHPLQGIGQRRHHVRG